MFKSPSYDFIILGAGAAGLSLLVRMLRSPVLRDKKILLIDKESKTKNDRTWCFWETKPGFFEEVVCKKWDRIAVLNYDVSISSTISPYQYKMIRGADFYQYCFNEINQHPNVEVARAGVLNWKQADNVITIETTTGSFELNDSNHTIVFSSLYRPATVPGAGSLRLLQHFKGWLIKTPTAIFNPSVATIMDFRADQQHGTTFTYVLPLDETTALVEYTLFSKNLLPSGDYDNALREYIRKQAGVTEFTILEEEFGVIPMTNEKFTFAANGWQIGTAGGQTKASSGFTFQFIQKQSDRIIAALESGRALASLPATPARFRFYDNTLLHILYHNQLPGHSIFTRLFKRNKPQQVLKFLDNESTLWEELKIISSLPTLPFLKASLRQL